MNKFILEELSKCKVAQLPSYTSDSIQLVILKGKRPTEATTLEYELDHQYRVVVENYIVKPYDGFTLHDNWNRGIVPDDVNMIIDVRQIRGKMICVNAVGETTKTHWEGWLPQKSVHKIEEL